jgi:hypothetical protein
MTPLDDLFARRLARNIHRLRTLGERCFPSRYDSDLQIYLSFVHGAYSGLRRRSWARQAANVLTSLFKLPARNDRHPIRAIIDASTLPKADAKAKSRATRALRYAWRQRGEWDDIIDFFQRNGGVAGCAAKFAQAHRSRRLDREKRCPVNASQPRRSCKIARRV